MGKGSSGSNQPTETQVTQTNLPDYAEPYYRDLLARAGYESATPYQPYQGQRLAYFSPMEQEGMARIGELGVSGTPEELNQAGRLALQAGQGFDPGITGGISSAYEAGAPGVNYGAASRRIGYNAGQRGAGYVAGSRGTDYTAGQADPTGGYTAGSRAVGFVPGTLADTDMISRYSDPYMQQVVDIQKREATRNADIREQQLGLGAARQGGLGGYRDAILRAENERNLTQELGDIQAEGSQRAFLNAQQAFEADRGARAQLEQFGQGQFGMNQELGVRAAELMQQGFSMNEAARQAQEEFGQQQFQMNQSAEQMMEQFGQQQFRSNEEARQAMENFAQSQFGMDSQNAQFAADLGMRKYNAYEQAKQQATALGLQADEIEQAGQIAAANIRLGQQQQQLGAAGMLGDFAGQRQAMEMERLNAMLGVGSIERGMLQQGLDIGYQDYIRQQAYPREQLSFYSQLLQGTPIAPGQTTATYGPRPSYGQQFLGSGIAGLGLYNAFNRPPGG